MPAQELADGADVADGMLGRLDRRVELLSCWGRGLLSVMDASCARGRRGGGRSPGWRLLEESSRKEQLLPTVDLLNTLLLVLEKKIGCSGFVDCLEGWHMILAAPETGGN